MDCSLQVMTVKHEYKGFMSTVANMFKSVDGIAKEGRENDNVTVLLMWHVQLRHRRNGERCKLLLWYDS